jgi:hypothetical protein
MPGNPIESLMDNVNETSTDLYSNYSRVERNTVAEHSIFCVHNAASSTPTGTTPPPITSESLTSSQTETGTAVFSDFR